MNINLYPSNDGIVPDFVIDANYGSVIAKHGLSKNDYLSNVNLKCTAMSYDAMIDLLVAAISIAEDKLGEFPQSQLSIRWAGQWPIIAPGASPSYDNIYYYQSGSHGELQSDDSPEGQRIKYMNHEKLDIVNFGVVYPDDKKEPSNHTADPTNSQNSASDLTIRKAKSIIIEDTLGNITKFEIGG